MGLSLVTAPTSNPISLVEMKEHLRIVVDDNNDDNYLDDIQRAATSLFTALTQYQVMQATYLLSLDEFPYYEIEIPIIPLISVSTLLYYTSASDTITLEENTDFYVSKSDRSAKIVPVSSWPTAYDRPDAVRITYIAGNASNIPDNLLHCIRLLVSNAYENRQPVVVGSRAEELPLSLKLMIDTFKRESF